MASSNITRQGTGPVFDSSDITSLINYRVLEQGCLPQSELYEQAEFA